MFMGNKYPELLLVAGLMDLQYSGACDISIWISFDYTPRFNSPVSFHLLPCVDRTSV